MTQAFTTILHGHHLLVPKWFYSQEVQLDTARGLVSWLKITQFFRDGEGVRKMSFFKTGNQEISIKENTCMGRFGDARGKDRAQWRRNLPYPQRDIFSSEISLRNVN